LFRVFQTFNPLTLSSSICAEKEHTFFSIINQHDSFLSTDHLKPYKVEFLLVPLHTITTIKRLVLYKQKCHYRKCPWIFFPILLLWKKKKPYIKLRNCLFPIPLFLKIKVQIPIIFFLEKKLSQKWKYLFFSSHIFQQ